jgi:hypothetical protein
MGKNAKFIRGDIRKNLETNIEQLQAFGPELFGC